jgi:hypothetical protein
MREATVISWRSPVCSLLGTLRGKPEGIKLHNSFSRCTSFRQVFLTDLYLGLGSNQLGGAIVSRLGQLG